MIEPTAPTLLETTIPETTGSDTMETVPPETIPTEDPAETETVPDATWEYLEDMETTETTAVVQVEFIPVVAESTNILSNVILCAALMIVGVLCGIRLWR